ncbi:hypothetical protein [Clavibacter michiganensis]|uniref:hypothetical protein n=1 Tax=Clavibacter michiganensis TaxID=28447 RepID=UPI001FB38581|nr:hypothetical protein [Clavibacter michiganensis]
MTHPTLAPAARALPADPADRPPTQGTSGPVDATAPGARGALRAVGRAVVRHPLAIAAVLGGSAWIGLMAGLGELAHPAATAIGIAVTVMVLAWSESRIGILRTALVAALGSLAPVAVASLLLAAGVALGDLYSQLDAADRLWAPSVVLVAVAAAASRGLAPAHRDGLRAAVLAAVLAGLLAGATASTSRAAWRSSSGSGSGGSSCRSPPVLPGTTGRRRAPAWSPRPCSARSR